MTGKGWQLPSFQSPQGHSGQVQLPQLPSALVKPHSTKDPLPFKK